MIAVAVVAFSGITRAEEEQDAPKKEVKAEQQQRNEARAEALRQRMQGAGGGEGRMQGRGSVDRESMMKRRTQMLEEQIAKEKEAHEAAVGELKAIKVLAEKEKATKTAAAIQKLIDKTNKKFEAKIKTQKERMQNAFQGGGRTDGMTRPRPGAEGEAAIRGRARGEGQPAGPQDRGARRGQGQRGPKEDVEKDFKETE